MDATEGFERFGTLRKWEESWSEKVRFIRGGTGRSFSDKSLNYGGNSGFQIIHLAIMWGAERVLLLGYDMKAKPSQKHWFGNHPGKMDKLADYGGWRAALSEAAREGHNIINCSRETSLTCFPRAIIQDVI